MTGKRVRLARAGMVGTLIAAGILTGAYVWRLEIATRAAIYLLAEQGVPFPRLRVTELSAHRVTVVDLRLGEPAEFEASRLRAEYGWSGKRAGLRALELEGARSTIDLREGKSAFGALQGPLAPLIAPASPTASPKDTTTALPRVRVTRSTLRILNDEGALELLVDLELDAAADGRELDGRLQLAAGAAAWNGIRIANASLSLPLRIELGPQATTVEWRAGSFEFSDLERPPVALDGRATVSLPRGRVLLLGPEDASSWASVTADVEVSALHVRGSDDVPELALRAFKGELAGKLGDGGFVGDLLLRAPGIDLVKQRVALRDIALEVSLPISAGPLKLSRVVVSDLDAARRFPVTELAALLYPPADGPAWRVEGELQSLSGSLRAALRAGLDPGNGAGDLHVDLAPVRFRAGGLRPEMIYPGLGVLGDVDGRLDAKGRIAWNANGVQSSEADIALTGISFRGPTAQIEDMSAALHLTSLFPLRSAAGQELHAVTLSTGGMKFDDARARFQVLSGASGPRLLVEQASLRLGHGILRVGDAMLDPAAPREFTVRAEEIRLEELFRLLDVAAVAGTGTISGGIPVRIEDQAVQIRGGVLQSHGPGVLNVRSEFARKALESAGESVALVSQALEDFHFERLRITIDKPFKGTSQLGIQALGMNPAVLKGQPFDLNIKVETDLEPLLRATSLGLRIPGEWARQKARPSR